MGHGYSVERLRDGISDSERNIMEMKRVIGTEMEKIKKYKNLIQEALQEAEEAEREANG